jgi:hypothetical protein
VKMDVPPKKSFSRVTFSPSGVVRLFRTWERCRFEFNPVFTDTGASLYGASN